jgi:ketosteroid isomerase-like protein
MKLIHARWVPLVVCAIGALAYGADGAQQPTTPDPVNSTGPVGVVEAFFKALTAGDFPSATALLDPEALIYESGGVERSRAEYAGHHMPEDAKFLKTATHRVVSRNVDSSDQMAWVATESRLTVASAKPMELISTETMVLRKRADGWRIVHIHWSSRKASK